GGGRAGRMRGVARGHTLLSEGFQAPWEKPRAAVRGIRASSALGFPSFARGVTFEIHGSSVASSGLRYDVSPGGDHVRSAVPRQAPISALRLRSEERRVGKA